MIPFLFRSGWYRFVRLANPCTMSVINQCEHALVRTVTVTKRVGKKEGKATIANSINHVSGTTPQTESFVAREGIGRQCCQEWIKLPTSFPFSLQSS